MAATLFDQLVEKPQRETAGSDAASRFDYQKNWAFCELIRKHSEGESYLIAFEFHDDVLFLSPSDQPSEAQFAQVKTSASAKPRTLTALTTRPKGKASILGKMCANFDGICATHDIRIVIVSNNAFEFADANICATDLEEKFRARLLKKLQAELSDFAEDQLARLHFHVSDVSLKAMQSFLKGEAVDLFNAKFGENHGLNVGTWIRLLQSEISRRNNFPSDEILDQEQLINKKCIDDKFVEAPLVHVHGRARQGLDVATVLSALGNAGWQEIEQLRLQKKLSEASADFFDPLNAEVQVIADMMWSCVDDWTNSPLGLAAFVDQSVDFVMHCTEIDGFYKKPDYLGALSCVIYYEKI